MAVKVFYSHKNKSKKEIIQFFEERNIPFTMKEITGTKLSWTDFLSIIELTEGIEDIIPLKPTKDAEKLLATIDFDTIKLTEFYELAAANPNIIRTPLIIGKGALMVGYIKDEMSMFDNRKTKRAKINKLIEAVRKTEIYTHDFKTKYVTN